MLHNTISRTVRAFGLFVRFRVSRELSLFKHDNDTILFSVAIRDRSINNTICIYLLFLLVIVGRSKPVQHNTRHSLVAYRTADGWFFDYPSEGVMSEPLFVEPSDALVGLLAYKGKSAADRIRLLFADYPASGITHRAVIVGRDANSTEYEFQAPPLTGLRMRVRAPVLSGFGKAPDILYFDARAYTK